MQIPKFIKDIKKYFMYEGSATPTTQDDLQAYMKNEHETLECLVDGLWQPETEYQEGHVVRSPNMPAGFIAVAKNAGYTSTNEPDWGTAAREVVDGGIVWIVQMFIISVNDTEPDGNGNISIPVATQAEAEEGLDEKKVMTPKNTKQAIEKNLNDTFLKGATTVENLTVTETLNIPGGKIWIA
ncbi:hypothetical protein [Phascolarctobacterium sp.]